MEKQSITEKYVGEVLTEDIASDIWKDGYDTSVDITTERILASVLSTLNKERENGADAMDLCMTVHSAWLKVFNKGDE